MKKLLLVIVSITIILGLGACDSTAQDDTRIEELELRVEELESRTAIIEDILVGLGILEGLNGVLVPYYTEPQLNELSVLPKETQLVRLNAMTTAELIELKDALDKDKYPSYMLDIDGYYISFNEIAELFKAKYFDGATVHEYDNNFVRGGVTQLRFVMLDTDYTADDVFARMILMLDELKNYEYYFISSSDIKLEIYWTAPGGSAQVITITTASTNLLSEALAVSVNGVWYGNLESEYNTVGVNLNLVNIQQYYDDYVTNLTYDGYVLDLG